MKNGKKSKKTYALMDDDEREGKTRSTVSTMKCLHRETLTN